MTEFGEILLLCQNFTSIRQFLSVYFLFGKMLRLLWRICYIVGLIFIVENGQIVKNSIDIWSHWFLCLTVRHHSLFLQRHPIFLSLSLCLSLISLSLSIIRSVRIFCSSDKSMAKKFSDNPEERLFKLVLQPTLLQKEKMEHSLSFE